MAMAAMSPWSWCMVCARCRWLAMVIDDGWGLSVDLSVICPSLLTHFLSQPHKQTATMMNAAAAAPLSREKIFLPVHLS